MKKIMILMMVSSFLSCGTSYTRMQFLDKSVLPMDMKKEVLFWAARFNDHTKYLATVTDSNALREELLALKSEFKLFVKRHMMKILTLHEQGTFNMNSYKKLLDKLDNLQNQVLEEVEVMPGYKVSKSLVKHMKEEYAYHLENINGKKRTAKKEMAFWECHDKEVADLKASLKNVSTKEKEIFDKLTAMGLDDHEAKEDQYAQTRIGKASQ